MRPVPILITTILVAPILAGCMSTAPEAVVPRFGDALVYSGAIQDQIPVTFFFNVSGPVTATVPHHGTCEAIHLELIDHSPAESKLCLDGSFNVIDRTSYIQQYTKTLESRVSVGAWKVGDFLMICALVCAPEMSDRHWNGSAPPHQKMAYVLTADSPDRYSVNITLTNIWKGVERTSYIEWHFQYEGLPYPQQIEVARRDEGGPVSFTTNFTLQSFGPGDGPPIPRSGGSFQPLEPSGSPVAWTRAPAEGDSPFTYPQQAARDQLASDPNYLDYSTMHPQHFLAAARYSEFHDGDNGQTEYLWDFLWQDGTDGFYVRCHLLSTPIPSKESPVTHYEDEHCFDHVTLRLPDQNRTDVPEQAVSWEEAARMWRDRIGGDEPLHHAVWTTYPERLVWELEEGELSPPTGDAIMMFSYHVGDITQSDPPPPTWRLEEPSLRRGQVISYSALDASNGQFWYLRSPHSIPI